MPEDCKEEGLVLTLQGHENLLASLKRYGGVWLGVVGSACAAPRRKWRRASTFAAIWRRRCARFRRQSAEARHRVVSHADVLLFDEPTRGAESEVYRLKRRT
jgi:ABC-type sugar transport system ATPase subunit